MLRARDTTISLNLVTADFMKYKNHIVWGQNDAHGPLWIKLAEYQSAKQVKLRQNEGWKTQILPVGVPPVPDNSPDGKPSPEVKPATPTPPKPKILAGNGARILLTKLERLVEAPGTPDEGKAAAVKLARLRVKFDFGQADLAKEEIFAGTFTRAYDSRPLATIHDMSIASAVKWAIEQATGISCCFQGAELRAHATETTAAKLSGIAATISQGFGDLWLKFRTFPTISDVDRGIFLRGLWDGMMDDKAIAGEQLPRRAAIKPCRRAGKRAVGPVSGLCIHPYSIALDLGKSIRFNVPLPEVINQLEQQKPKEIAV